MARIVLITPARRFIANRFGLGYQVPLGLVYIGGPLVDAGHTVRLIDNDVYGWSLKRLVREVIDFKADYALVGHTGSTAAHAVAIATISAIRADAPWVRTIYGGVYPSYADKPTLNECPAIDVIVRGEGEKTIIELIDVWERYFARRRGGSPFENSESGSTMETRSYDYENSDSYSACTGGSPFENSDSGSTMETRPYDLTGIPGITWRNGDKIIANPSRPAIQNLDSYRPGFELVDWPRYKLFGFGPAAGLQFSRGCPLTCSYCGQWMFWKKWRHRSPEVLVAQMTELSEKYGVKFIWFADENFSADRETVKRVFELICAANLNISLNLNMTAADVVRDADLLPLYKAAGVDYIVMGVESLEDSVVAGVRKNNPYAISKEAVRLLRENNIISLTNIIYGLEQESWATLWAKFRKLLEFDSDILNACYITPHFWTSDGKATRPDDIIQLDMSKWTYRNQVVATPTLTPPALFVGVKLTEAFFHLRPKALLRLISHPDARYRKIMRHSFWVGIKVVLAEIAEFLFETKFAPRGAMDHIPGSVVKETELPVLQM